LRVSPENLYRSGAPEPEPETSVGTNRGDPGFYQLLRNGISAPKIGGREFLKKEFFASREVPDMVGN
jgi:hypothetical protein